MSGHQVNLDEKVTGLEPMAALSLLPVPAELEREIDAVIGNYPVSRRSAVMTLLHMLQEHYGFISEDLILWVAEKLELKPINVLEVVTFYPMYRQAPAGKTHFRICRTLSCAMAGSYQLLEALCEKTGIDRSAIDHHHPVGVSADGEVSVEFVECLASCGTAPVCLVQDDLHENVTVAKLDELLAGLGLKLQPKTPLEAEAAATAY